MEETLEDILNVDMPGAWYIDGRVMRTEDCSKCGLKANEPNTTEQLMAHRQCELDAYYAEQEAEVIRERERIKTKAEEQAQVDLELEAAMEAEMARMGSQQ